MVDATKVKRWGRWLGTFVGFPLAGVAARLVAGDIGDAPSAVAGGLAAGAVLGVVQAGIGGIARGDWMRWVLGTTAGFAAGLTAGSAVVGYRTDTASLVVLGALTGAGVGLGQAASLRVNVARRVSWALATPALWAGGWLITSQVIVDAENRHAAFGSSGALAVCALAGLLRARWNDPVRTGGLVRSSESVLA